MKSLGLSIKEKEEFLAAHPLFSLLKGQARQRLASSSRAWSCRPGDVLITQGDRGNRVFAIKLGLCRAVGNDEDLMAYRGASALIGAHCAIDEFSHRHTTQVILDSEILELDKELFVSLAKESNPLLLELMKILHEELDQQSFYREQMTKCTAKGRVSTMLLHILEAYASADFAGQDMEHTFQRDDDSDWLLPLHKFCPFLLDWLTQEQIANHTGLVPRTVRGALQDLMAHDAIKLGERSSITIINPTNLFKMMTD